MLKITIPGNGSHELEHVVRSVDCGSLREEGLWG